MENELFTLTTIPEIARCWGLHPKTVRRALDARRNPLQARKSGRIILISVSSVERRWGAPIRPLSRETLL